MVAARNSRVTLLAGWLGAAASSVCVFACAGPPGAPATAVWASRDCGGQGLGGGDLLQDLPAVSRLQPPPQTDPPESAAGPAHR